MELASIISQYKNTFEQKYHHQCLPVHSKALRALLRCRTPDSGELYLQCSQCDHTQWRPLSCGHRSCPKCQNYEVGQWLERQKLKLLPVEYFMVTFTLPYELRAITWDHQKRIYSIMFNCISSTLKDFGLNPKNLGADLGMTAVLHTHTRKLDFHPHIHVIVPGGGIDKKRKQWKKLKGDYLFNEFSLAKVFRARFLEQITQAKLSVPHGITKQWVVDCLHVGKGLPALKYLSRYLYRGVISEKNIISNQQGWITFQYTESCTGKTCHRSLKGEDFLWLILQHVLPKGFRRLRDYGFLHANAKKLLSLVQLVLHVIITLTKPKPRPVFKCPLCKASMIIKDFRQASRSG